MTTGSEKPSGGTASGWRGLWLSSWILSLCLFGDALIYIVLPVNAELFGISLAWVGILLAANRIIRTFIYGWVVRLGEWIGLKNLCLLTCFTAVMSTAGYGLLEGGLPLLGSRMLWGISYAGLLLVTLLAARDRARTGTRVGISRAVEQVGPLLAMTVGTRLAGVVGAKDVFIYLDASAWSAALFSPAAAVGGRTADGRRAAFDVPQPGPVRHPDLLDGGRHRRRLYADDYYHVGTAYVGRMGHGRWWINPLRPPDFRDGHRAVIRRNRRPLWCAAAIDRCVVGGHRRVRLGWLRLADCRIGRDRARTGRSWHLVSGSCRAFCAGRGAAAARQEPDLA